MKSEAVKVITSSDTNAPLKAKALQGVKVLHSETQLSLVGFENGAFAVIANDDAFQPVWDIPQAAPVQNMLRGSYGGWRR